MAKINKLKAMVMAEMPMKGAPTKPKGKPTSKGGKKGGKPC